MSLPKSRIALAKAEEINGIVLIGGSVKFNDITDAATSQCELYIPSLNTFYFFPPLQ